MGTLSTRDLREFGVDIASHIEGLEDTVASRIEGLSTSPRTEDVVSRVRSALPSVSWLLAAGLSLAGSLVMRHYKKHTPAMFLGMGVPAFLLAGVYEKLRTGFDAG